MSNDLYRVEDVERQTEIPWDSPISFDDRVTALELPDPNSDGSFLHDEPVECIPSITYPRTEEFASSLVDSLHQKGSIGITLRGSIREGSGSNGNSHLYTATGKFAGRDFVYEDGRGPLIIEHTEARRPSAQTDLQEYSESGPRILAESLTRNSNGFYSATPNGLNVRISKKR